MCYDLAMTHLHARNVVVMQARGRGLRTGTSWGPIALKTYLTFTALCTQINELTPPFVLLLSCYLCMILHAVRPYAITIKNQFVVPGCKSFIREWGEYIYYGQGSRSNVH